MGKEMTGGVERILVKLAEAKVRERERKERLRRELEKLEREERDERGGRGRTNRKGFEKKLGKGGWPVATVYWDGFVELVGVYGWVSDWSIYEPSPWLGVKANALAGLRFHLAIRYWCGKEGLEVREYKRLVSSGVVEKGRLVRPKLKWDMLEEKEKIRK